MGLYDQDFVLWSEETARAISEGRWNAIDRAALADEVESLGKRDRREVVSRMAVIITHLLKTKYQPARETRSWRNSIARERRELELILADSPSLRSQLPDLLSAAYDTARLDAAAETGLPVDTFPVVCEWSAAEVLP